MTDPLVILNGMRERMEQATTFLCDFCGYPDENAYEKLWSCSICGSEDADVGPARVDFEKAALIEVVSSVLRKHNLVPHGTMVVCEHCSDEQETRFIPARYPCPTVRGISDILNEI